jgi:hypothetical protein
MAIQTTQTLTGIVFARLGRNPVSGPAALAPYPAA